jgi:hypothetical protein
MSTTSPLRRGDNALKEMAMHLLTTLSGAIMLILGRVTPQLAGFLLRLQLSMTTLPSGLKAPAYLFDCQLRIEK